MLASMAYEDAVFREGGYPQKSVRGRILAFFLDNLGKVALREQIQEAARDPKTRKIPENWHQRLSELRTDHGYTILSHRNRGDLKVMEYVMLNAEKRAKAKGRIRPTPATWKAVLLRAGDACEWRDQGAVRCGLANGAIDPIGGGTVNLTPDHRTPHEIDPDSDPADSSHWQALCGRHQVIKKNFWDDRTGNLNVYAIIQAASEADKRRVYDFLKTFFGD
jgi:hypothetical protein